MESWAWSSFPELGHECCGMQHPHRASMMSLSSLLLHFHLCFPADLPALIPASPSCACSNLYKISALKVVKSRYVSVRMINKQGKHVGALSLPYELVSWDKQMPTSPHMQTYY
eukprot:1151921-Pelagomonas_calceolata.AAC.3